MINGMVVNDGLIEVDRLQNFWVDFSAGFGASLFHQSMSSGSFTILDNIIRVKMGFFQFCVDIFKLLGEGVSGKNW